MNLSQKLQAASRFAYTRLLGQIRSRELLERWQERRIVQHIARVRERSDFYREWWKGKPDSEWRSFPVIDKTIMMEHFDRLNTAGIRKEEAMRIALEAEKTRDFQSSIRDITIGLSSGTSGSRGLFLVSEKERLAWAGAVLAKLLPDALFREEQIAFFLRADSKLYQSVGQGRLKFDYYDLLVPFDEHVVRLNETPPSVLAAPPSMLRMLAESLQAGRLRIRPRKVISVAEVLDPLDRMHIESAFDLRLHQVYQCTEGFLAATCSYGTLHLNEDIVHIGKEYTDASLGKFIPIITDFSRMTQPIIRYRLNDLLTEKRERCPCGSPFTAIESIDGRSDDLFYVPSLTDSGKTVPVFPDFVSRAVIQASEHIEEYEAVQTAPQHVRVSLRVDSVYRDEAERRVRLMLDDLCERAGCKPLIVEFAPYVKPERDRKLRRVRRG